MTVAVTTLVDQNNGTFKVQKIKKRCPAEWERAPGTFGNHTKGGYEKNLFATNYVAQSVPTFKKALKTAIQCPGLKVGFIEG